MPIKVSNAQWALRSHFHDSNVLGRVALQVYCFNAFSAIEGASGDADRSGIFFFHRWTQNSTTLQIEVICRYEILCFRYHIFAIRSWILALQYHVADDVWGHRNATAPTSHPNCFRFFRARLVLSSSQFTAYSIRFDPVGARNVPQRSQTNSFQIVSYFKSAAALSRNITPHHMKIVLSPTRPSAFAGDPEHCQ